MIRWPELVAQLIDVIDGDDTLSGIFGAAVTDEEERTFRVPSLTLDLVSNVESENYESSLVQFTIWTRSKEQQVNAETALRRLFQRRTPYTLGTMQVWSRYEGRARLEGPQDGTLGVAVDYSFSPLAARYVPTDGESL
jgi:hypothetical protein